jgi:hypothetical protein
MFFINPCVFFPVTNTTTAYPCLHSTHVRSIHWWSHADRVLPAGRRVAALTDEHSSPKLWIHASIVSFVESRSKYQVGRMIDCIAYDLS